MAACATIHGGENSMPSSTGYSMGQIILTSTVLQAFGAEELQCPTVVSSGGTAVHFWTSCAPQAFRLFYIVMII